MHPAAPPARPPPTLVLAAAIAFVIAAFDVVVTFLAMADGTGGRAFGALLRDGVLVLGGVMMLRRARWALWLTVALFALSLLRVLAADELAGFLVNGLAVPGLVFALLPASRQWVAPPAAQPEPAAA